MLLVLIQVYVFVVVYCLAVGVLSVRAMTVTLSVVDIGYDFLLLVFIELLLQQCVLIFL